MGTSAQPDQSRRIRNPKFAQLAIIGLTLLIALFGAAKRHAGAPGPEPDETNIEATPVAQDRPNAEKTQSISRNLPRDDDGEAHARNVRVEPLVVLDPSARLLSGSDASESWTLYIELESGHRISQQFLLSNAGPGDHNAVALGHLTEVGRKPYRYANGRRRARWTLSEDRLFFDIAASHLDLHRPTGELRITKDDIEIRLFFDFAESDLARSVPSEILPKKYHVEMLAMAARTQGTIQAPWMNDPIETRGRTWLVHTWTKRSEAELINRRIDFFGVENGTSFYGIQLRQGKSYQRSWLLSNSSTNGMIESLINVPANWTEGPEAKDHAKSPSYPVPSHFAFSSEPLSGQITLGREWLRFDPLAVLPQPFRWFVRRKSKPLQVWAEAEIGVRLSKAPETPSLPDAGETESDSNSKRETEEKTADRSVTGVASITFLNPSERR